MKLIKEVEACDFCQREVKNPDHCYFCRKVGHPKKCIRHRLSSGEGIYYPFCDDCWGSVMIVKKGTVIQ